MLLDFLLSFAVAFTYSAVFGYPVVRDSCYCTHMPMFYTPDSLMDVRYVTQSAKWGFIVFTIVQLSNHNC